MMAVAALNNSHPAVGAVAWRVLLRGVRKVITSLWTWVMLAMVVALAIVANVRALPLTLAAPAQDAADQYVEALKTGDVDGLLASLSPDARTDLQVVGRFMAQPGTPAERRAARTMVARDHIDRYTRLGEHATEDGRFVVYAVERDAADGTHTQPLVVWLDKNGRVARTSM